jgi:hypothetical protein
MKRLRSAFAAVSASIGKPEMKASRSDAVPASSGGHCSTFRLAAVTLRFFDAFISPMSVTFYHAPSSVSMANHGKNAFDIAWKTLGKFQAF